jgi:transcription termination factor Rho
MSTYTSLPILARGTSLAVATAAASLIALAVVVPVGPMPAPPGALAAIGTMTLAPAAALWRLARDLVDAPPALVAAVAPEAAPATQAPAAEPEDAPAPAEAAPADAPAETALTFEAPVSDTEIEDLRRLLLGHASAPSITSVARALGISTGEASKRVARAEAAGLVVKRREGKRVTVTLVA